MCGESSSAQTYNSGLLHNIADLLLWQLCRIAVCTQPLYSSVLTIIFHHNGVYHRTVCNTPWLNCFDRSGNRTDNICRNEAAGFADFLACQNLVTLFHQRNRRSADVLRHWINQISLRHQDLYRLVLGQFFSFIRMNAAFKCSQSHESLPSFSTFFLHFIDKISHLVIHISIT